MRICIRGVSGLIFRVSLDFACQTRGFRWTLSVRHAKLRHAKLRHAKLRHAKTCKWEGDTEAKVQVDRYLLLVVHVVHQATCGVKQHVVLSNMWCEAKHLMVRHLIICPVHSNLFVCIAA